MKKSFIAVCLSLAVSLSGSVYAQNYASDAVYYPSGSSVQVKTVGLEQNLQGSWFGTNGKDSMLLIFMNNMVGMALNGQQIYGNFTVNGNQLVMRFQNGKSLSYNMNLNGDVLVLDNSITLNRQQAGSNPQIPQSDNGTSIYQDGQTRGDFQSQNNGGWGGGTQGQSSGGWGGQIIPAELQRTVPGAVITEDLQPILKTGEALKEIISLSQCHQAIFSTENGAVRLLRESLPLSSTMVSMSAL